MSSAKGLVPELRFPECEGEWRLMKLGELLSFKNGLNSDKDKYGQGVKFINVLDIINNSYITYDRIIGKVEVTDKEFEKNEVVYGDILFQRSSETRDEVGQANVYLDKEKSAVFGGFVIRGQKKQNYHPKFMNYLLKTDFTRKEITTKSGGSTRYNVGQDILREVKIIKPSLPEQQKIASFLSAVDKKIEKLTRKKELLQVYKKGVMQKIFSQEIRFKDDDGKTFPDWEEKKLGNLVKISSGISPSKSNLANKGKYLFLKVEDLNNCAKYQLESRFYSSEEKYIVKSSAVIFPKRGAAIFNNKVRITVNPVLMDSNLMAIYPNSNQLENNFLYYTIFFIKLFKIADTSTIPQINHKHIVSFRILLPCVIEQKKIANFLSNIDKKIELTQNQLTQTQTFKKGLLQKMFV